MVNLQLTLLSFLLVIPSFIAKSQFIQSETYVCQKSIGSINVDGRANEPSWFKAKWTSDFVDIEGNKNPRPYLKAQVKMLWDNEFFYFYAKLEEPHVWASLKQRDTVIYWDNDFELFIDPNEDTQNYFELELNALNTVWDLMLTKPYRDGGKAITSWDIKGLKTAVHIEGTLNNSSDVDSYWSVEAAIPWKSLQEITPKKDRLIAGKTMRVNYSRVQWETEVINGKYIKKKLPENNWVWSPQRAIAMHEPEFWGRVYFSSTANEEVYFDERSEKVRQLLYSIHRAQRSRFKKLSSFSENKEDVYDGSPNINWTLDADTYWYHVKMVDPYIEGLIWYIDENGKIWKEEG